MLSTIKSTLSNSIASAFYNSVLYNNEQYYVAYGNGIPWSANETVPQPYDNDVDAKIFRNNMILTKKINSSDIAFSAKNITWSSGTIYDFFDDALSPTFLSHSGASELKEAVFYVMTSDFNVYKCLNNNLNSPSTIQPSGTSIFPVLYNDGYIWKYLYTIPVALRNKFITPQSIPVITSVSQEFYSGGQILNATITTTGSGYTTASVQVAGDGTSYYNPRTITALTITNSGSGYQSSPTVTFSAPVVVSGSSVQATATCTINASGQVDSTTISNIGYGYDDTVTITFSAPITGSISWTANTVYTSGQILFTGLNYYTVTVGGTSGSTAPTATSGTITDGTATLSYSGTQAFGTVTSFPNSAVLNPVISGGQIVGIQIVDAGIGYSYANITISGDGTGAAATSSLSSGDLNTGQSIVELNAVRGALSNIVVTNGGSNYVATPTVTISGDGTGATATATLENNQVKYITITNYGSGYTYATATISGFGTGATARVILAPYNGHGSNAVNELFATKLNIYLTIGNEENYGLTPNTNYRQLGIIKNPYIYGTTQRFTESLGSPCYKLTGTGNIPPSFSTGTTLTQAGHTYLLISVGTNEILVQSTDNTPPVTSAL